MTEFGDRDYRFIIRTFDRLPGASSESDLYDVASAAADAGFIGWRHGRGVVGVDGYDKVGDVELRTDHVGARDWQYCLVAELDADTAFPEIDAAAIDAERLLLADHGIDLLSIEAAVRPAGAGTAIPRPSRHWAAFPSHFEAAIEYIDIPPGHWEDYRQFMRNKFGPVGRGLVEQGDSYKVVITEIVRSYFRAPTLPEWNRIHILTGDFTSGDFFDRTAELVRGIVGADYSVEAALGLAAYRRKPRMSRNRLALSDRAFAENHGGSSD